MRIFMLGLLIFTHIVHVNFVINKLVKAFGDRNEILTKKSTLFTMMA